MIPLIDERDILDAVIVEIMAHDPRGRFIGEERGHRAECSISPVDKNGNRVIPGICHGQVRVAVAIQIANRYAIRSFSRGDYCWSAECSIPIVEKNADVVRAGLATTE